MNEESSVFLERRVGSTWGMTKNKYMISLARSAHANWEQRGGTAEQPCSLGRSIHGKDAHFHPHYLPSHMPAKLLVQPPKKPDRRTHSSWKKNIYIWPFFFFFGWDQISDLVLHITAQMLMLAIARVPSGEWKMLLGVEKGGDKPVQAALLLDV